MFSRYSRRKHQKRLLRPALAKLILVSSSLAYVEGEVLNTGTGDNRQRDVI